MKNKAQSSVDVGGGAQLKALRTPAKKEYPLPFSDSSVSPLAAEKLKKMGTVEKQGASHAKKSA